MGDGTGIEWVQDGDKKSMTWNPTTGCDKASSGCDRCYAMTAAARMKAMGVKAYQRDGDPLTSGPGFALTMHEDRLDAPIRKTKPRAIFVNSMSDLFHPDVTDDFVARVFAVMAVTPRHTYQLLTKRHGRLRSLLNRDAFWAAVAAHAAHLRGYEPLAADIARQTSAKALDHVWIGVSAENQQWADIRIPALLSTPAAVRFVSAEPLLGPIDFDRATPAGSWLPTGGLGARDCSSCPPGCTHLDWVITGGESGPAYRPMDLNWIRDMAPTLEGSAVAWFHKQNGGPRPKSLGKEVDGRTWCQMPARAAS